MSDQNYKYEFTNNAESTLAVAISSTSQTTITVASGDGALFPSLTGDGSDYFTITVVKSDGTREIMLIVDRSSDALTVGVAGSGSANSSGRGIEGTSATTFSIGDIVELRLTKGALNSFVDTFKELDSEVNDIGDFGGGSQTINLNSGRCVLATVSTSEVTFTFSNPLSSGTLDGFILYLTNGGSQTINWPANTRFSSSTEPEWTSSGTDVIVFVTHNGGTNWDGFRVGINIGTI